MKQDPKSEEYFQAQERKGGPVDPLTHFKEVAELLFKGAKGYQSPEKLPIYEHLEQFSWNNGEEEDGKANEEANGEEEEKELIVDQSKWKRKYDELTETERQIMKVDEIFALYLFRTSQKVNRNFYKTVLQYVILFRECLNEIGWQKKKESEENDNNNKEAEE